MDQLREDTRERTWEDYVETAGAVLAIGAGAAHFLRGGGAKRLNRFGEYLSSARRAINEGAFDGFDLANGFSRAKTLAMREPGAAIKIDTTADPLFASMHKGAEILNGGIAKKQAEGDFIRGFRTEYGRKAMDQMLEAAQYLDEDQMNMLRSMTKQFSSGEGMSSLTIEANLRRMFGERGGSDQVISEALQIANETQRLMRDDTNPAIKQAIENANIQKSAISLELGRFNGFQNGIGSWDMQDVVERVEKANPEQKVQAMANAALDLVAIEKHQEEMYSGPMERLLRTALGDRVTFGEAARELTKEQRDQLFASRSAVTVSDGKPVFANTFDILENIRNQRFTSPEDAARFNNLIIGNLRRGADGKIYSTAGIEDMLVNFGQAFSETLPGKMFRTTELLYNRQQPGFKVFQKGTLDYSLATALSNHPEELRTIKDVVWMNGRFYEESGTGWVASERLKDLTLMPNKVGTAREMMQGMRDARRAKEQGQGFLQNIWQEDTFVVRKLSEQYGNQFNWGLGPNNASVSAAQMANGSPVERARIMNQMKGLFDTFDKYGTLQYELNAADLKQLWLGLRDRGADTSNIKYAIRILQDPTDEYAIRYASQLGSKDSPGSIMNPALSQLLSNFQRDYKKTLAQHITRTDQAKKTANGVHYLSQPFKQNLAQELVQEALMHAGSENIEAIIINGRFRGQKASNLRSFAATGLFNKKANRHVYGVSLEEQTVEALKYLDKIQQPGATAEERFVFSGLTDLQKRFDLNSSFFAGSGERLGYSSSGRAIDRVDDWAAIHKGYGLMDSLKTAMRMVRQSNDAERSKAIVNAAREALKPFTQFFSGEDMFHAPSRFGILGYRMMNLVDEQLNRSINIFGRHFELNLGLNKKDKGSGYEILQNLVLKRVFPAAAAITYLDFLDDSARAITGMGLGEAGMSGLANIDLAARKITGATGLDYIFKGITADNPFARYYGGYFGDINPEWQSYEERKDYYERGYTPIRKARYWKFGSSNEYRGGRVSYFEPNTLRMMRSNYFMESMYEGSMWTKWSHSLLPTPLNPLSPLNYMLDPYYLEELHKEDRPYPITGSTFAENTPWGIVLNPFFDNFIKPRRQMYRDRLGEDGVDVKALIAHVNDNIRRRTNNQQNGDILYLQNGKLRSMLFTAFNAPTPGERIIGQQGTSVTTSTEYGEYGAGINAGEYPSLAESNADQMQASSIAGSAIGTPVNAERLSISDRLVISSGKGNVAAGMLVDAMKSTGIFDALRGANAKIRQQGMLRKDQGLFYENKMQYESNAVDDLLADSETIADLMTQGQGHDYVHEMAVSARMVTGLYGYMASLAFGIGENNQKRIATSANMESAGRSFWDLSVGGFDPTGGDIMEIMRRFIPEYHRMQQVNPLMNNLPDWLPDRFRFGDAYCVSGDTLIEVNNLQFIPASDIIMSDNILTHKGQLKQVEGVVARSIQKQEKVYQFKICSISAIESKFSENHPILRCKSPEQRRNYSPFVKIKLYEQANLVLDALNNGIVLKRDLAECCGSDIDSVYRIFNVLYQNGLIEDPKTHKHFIDLKQYKPFDLELLRRDLEWTKAKDIRPGDYVAYPLPEYSEQDIVLDLADYIKDYPATDRYIYTSGTLRNIETAEAYEWLEENGVPIFNHRNRKQFLEQHHWNAKSYENAQTAIRIQKPFERIDRFIKLTPELCYAFGVYVAEGWPDNKGIGLATHITEEWMVKRAFNGLKAVFPRISYKFRQVKGTNGAQTTITGKYIGILCEALFGKKAHNKHVPEFFWNAQKECILRFIEGYFDGDGCHYITKSGVYQEDNFHIGATSVSLSLLLQIRKLLLRFKVVGSVQYHNKTSIVKKAPKLKQKEIHSGISYSFCIRGYNAEYLSYLLWNTDKPDPHRRINTYSFISEGYVYLRVLSKIECPEVDTVWGFQIADDKSFCTVGIATHNTSLPKGEARLPGRGYESLNQLHPDVFGRYGAFDRFKILADIAPYSPEYKFWKKVVSSTIRDPELKKEIQEVKDRVAEQTKGHDFFEYRYVGRGMEQQNAVVSEVLNFGKFKIVGSEQIYKLSGVKIAGNPNETTQQVLSRYLLPGQEITMFMDENPAYARNNDKDKTINAGVMVAGENIAEQMLEAGDAKKRKGDTSAPSYMLNHGSIVNGLNYLSEMIGHANIPVIHSRWMNMNSPLEQYLDDNVYGTSFQSWSSPWATYIRPSLQIEASDPTWLSIGILANVLRDNVKNEGKQGVRNVIRETLEAAGHFKGQVPSRALNYASMAARMLDRGALAGSIAGGVAFMGSSGALAKVEQMQKLGHVAGVAYAAIDNPHNLAVSTTAWSRLGYLVANEVLHKNRTLMTIAGAAIGAARWASAQKLLASDDTANTYIPEETRKKWDMQEYLDRLTYIKYMGLFEQAADMAKDKEGIDIRAILASQEREREELKAQKEKLHQDLRELDNRHDADAEEAKKLIRRKLNQLSGVKLGLRGGEFTKSAIMYKNAADATMFGLSEDAVMADIVRALPKTERDYFIEFMKEKDAEKREEILSTVSPLLNRALRTIWKMPLPEKVSNEEYFEHHTLPAPTWAGWRPNIDLANVAAKVIYNEGMQYSDMGVYASQYREPAVINAPNIDYSTEERSTLLTRLKLQMALTGTGVDASSVSVEPSQDSGIQVIANVARIIPYKINQEFENLFN